MAEYVFAKFLAPPEDEAKYLIDYYGSCKRPVNQCHCLKNRWKGQSCPDWVPLGVRTFQELLEWNRIQKLGTK